MHPVRKCRLSGKARPGPITAAVRFTSQPPAGREPDMDRYKVLCAGVFSLILALGVARFAYTPLLPLMQQQAGLGVAEAGWLAAINYIGYLTGAVAASLIGDLVLKDRLY